MADTSDAILRSGRVTVAGQPTETFEAFGKYFGILKQYWGRLAACHVNFQGLDPAKDDGFYMPIYYADIGINLKAFRDAAQTLRTAGANTQLQLDLIAETENLNHHWNDPAADAALENYKHNKERMEQDQQNLAGHAQNFAQVADNLQVAMEQKRDGAAKAVDGLINQALRNSPGDFENRLRTACESIEANNQGGGIGGFGFHQYLYQHHGAPGENWNANDVRNDIENSVIKGFAVACDGLERIEQPTHDHIRDCYQILLSELGATDGGPQPGGATGSVEGWGDEQPVSRAKMKEVMESQGSLLPDEDLDRYGPRLNQIMKDLGLDTPEQQAAFLAQVAVETDSLLTMRQRGDFTGYPLMQGRGFLQLTNPADPEAAGFDNYKSCDKYLHEQGILAPGESIVTNPELITQRDDINVAVSEWYWRSATGSSLSSYANSENFDQLSAGVNAGSPNAPTISVNGLQKRRDYFEAAKKVLGA